MSGSGTPTCTTVPGQVAGEERLLQHARVADRLDAHVGAEAAGGVPDRLDRIGATGVDRVGGAEALGPLQLPVVEVDGDDRRGAGQPGAGDGGVAHPAAAEHGHAVAPQAHAPRVDRRAEPAITPQPSRPATSGRTAGSTGVHWPAATSVFSAKAPMPSAGDSVVPSVSVIFWAALRWRSSNGRPRRQARHWPHTARQSRTTESPAPRRPRPTHGLDHARGLAAQQEGEVVVDAALPVVQVGVAHPARLHRDQRLAGTGVGHDDRVDLHRRALAPGDHPRTSCAIVSPLEASGPVGPPTLGGGQRHAGGDGDPVPGVDDHEGEDELGQLPIAEVLAGRHR